MKMLEKVLHIAPGILDDLQLEVGDEYDAESFPCYYVDLKGQWIVGRFEWDRGCFGLGIASVKYPGDWKPIDMVAELVGADYRRLRFVGRDTEATEEYFRTLVNFFITNYTAIESHYTDERRGQTILEFDEIGRRRGRQLFGDRGA